ncbi:MAG: hypothetical protein RL398_2372 [Planctomycetota bacterium]|jgi:hypothetical protein
MRTTAIAAVALLAAGLCAQGGAKAQAGPGKAAYEKFVAEYKAETDAYMAEIRKLTATDEYKKAVEARDTKALSDLRSGLKMPDAKGFATKAIAAAAQFQGDDCVPFLAWAMQNGDKDTAKKAADEILGKHAASDALLPVVESSVMLLRTLGQDGGAEFLAKIAAATGNAEIKANALYWPAYMGMRAKDVTDMQKAAFEEQVAEARKLADGTLLADRIDAPKFIAERLQIGMEAPDIAGEDVDGVAFKLSDYRGKVVVLDFWGFW